MPAVVHVPLEAGTVARALLVRTDLDLLGPGVATDPHDLDDLSGCSTRTGQSPAAVLHLFLKSGKGR